MAHLDHSPKASLESLPVELKRAILNALPDVSALVSAVLSGPALYNALLGVQNQTLHEALLNELHPNVLPEALMVLQSRKLAEKGRTKEKVEALLTTGLEDRRTPEPRWTLSDATTVSQLHGHVDFFTTDFALTTLANAPDAASAPLTAAESVRIQRAFYHFELNCTLFRKVRRQERHSPEEQSTFLFSRYSPWENEQLASVFDYLYRRISKAFNDVAAHDIVWGEMSIEDDDDPEDQDNRWKQGMLSHGLSFLHKVATARTYRDRYLILDPALGSDYQFIYSGLLEANDEGSIIDLIDMSDEEQRSYVTEPFADDPDSGPADAWRWTHEYFSPNLFICSAYHQSVRRQGYVMWDRARLCKWGFFSGTWQPPACTHDSEAFDRRYDALRESFDARSELFARGARGWWSKEDQSKILWPGHPRNPEFDFHNYPYKFDFIPWKMSYLKLPSRASGQEFRS